MGQMVLESISSGLQPDALPSKLLPRISLFVTHFGHEKSPVFVTPGFERDSEHDRESQAQVLIGKRIGGSDAILFLFSLLSFETRS